MKSVRWMTSLPLSFKGEPADNIFDAWSSTGYRRPLDTDYVDLDLGECCLLSEVSFCPYLDVEYKEDEIYELCIWQNGWQVVTLSLIHISEPTNRSLSRMPSSA
mgnify:CR=1 FL=1